MLLSRGQSASNQLEATSTATPARTYTSQGFCESAGLFWVSTESAETDKCKYKDAPACRAAGGIPATAASTTTETATGKFCNNKVTGVELGKIV